MAERTADHWNARYCENNTPWEQGVATAELGATLDRLGITSGKALEICCGSGNDVIAMAKRGLAVTGLDIAPRAIELAGEKAAAAGVTDVTLVAHDLMLPLPVEAGSFVFAFDRGGFHSFDDAGRPRVAEHIAAALSPGGHWLTLCGNADDPTEGGPPRLTAAQITAAVETHFEVITLTRGLFREAREPEPQPYWNWTVLLRRRG